MQPAFADESPIDPFNFWKGADFKLKIRKVEGYWNYDKSEFAAPGTLGGFDDDKLEGIWNQGYSLAEFEDPKNFKSYEQLTARMNLVLGKTSTASAPVIREDEEEVFAKPEPVENWGAEVSDFRQKAVASSPVESDDDTLSMFQRLVDEED